MKLRALTAVVTGTATTLYYATPDLIASRRTRGWAKAGLLAVMAAASVPEFRATRDTDGDGEDAQGTDSPQMPEWASAHTLGKVAVVGVGVAFIASSIASTVAMERWIYRHGQRRAAAGRHLPHTRPALVYGTLAAAVSLAPSSSPSPSAER